MSKIICDVCGTSFSETANQCPICGCVRSVDARVVSGDINETEVRNNGTYTHVRGGRFSKANVKKRNKNAHTVTSADVIHQGDTDEERTTSNAGLVATAITLLLAIVIVVAYIFTRFFAPNGDVSTPGSDPVTPNATTQSTEATSSETNDATETTELKIPCTEIVTSKTTVEFDKAGSSYLLNVTTAPADTTDMITFVSADESVAKVSQDGNIVSVGPGETVITVSCGSVTAQCNVVCTFEVESTEQTEVPTYPTDDFKLKKNDITMGERGQLFVLYNGKIPADLIVWTSDNEKVATVENGTVKAVGKGTTKVYAEYGGVKLECIVRCSNTVGTYVESNTPNGGSEGSGEPSVHLNKTDVTLYLGKIDSFTLRLLDKNGAIIETEWTVADPKICSITEGLVEDLAVGRTTISTTYEGVTYSCIVRVAP